MKTYLYNQPNQKDTSILQILLNNQPSENEPAVLRSEVQSAIKRLKGHTAAGDDGISAEEIKAAGEKGVDIIHKVCNQIWNSEVIPEDWRKNDKMDLANYRGISLLSLASKVFCTIIQTRIQKKTEETLSESKGGFRAGRSSVDQLFSLRQLAEKFTEIGSPNYCCYIKYQKVFDTVWQEGLWKAMEHLGYPSKGYGCETWTLKKKDEQRLLVSCLRKIRGVTRLDKIRNTAIREALNFHISIVNRVRVKQLTYFGHVKRMPSYADIQR